MNETTSLRVGHIVGGRYRLEEPISRAAEWTLFRATHLELEHDVAIQVFARGFEDDAASRGFRRDLRVLSKLRHPNIAHLHDFGQCENGEPFVVVDYIHGTSLFRRLATERSLTELETLELLRAVAGALRYAHQFGVLHLALVPSMVLFDDTTRELTPKLLGFLPAQVAALRATEGPLIPDYRVAAPELLAGEPARPAADVYALGHLAYACLTGDLPVVSTVAEVGRSANSSSAPITLPENAEISAEVRALVERCLAKDLNARYADTDAVIAAVDEIETNRAATLQLRPVRTTSTGYFPCDGEIFADKFRVQENIGSGAYARVYRAVSLQTGGEVALKILRPDRKAQSNEALRFMREGRLVFTMLKSPHTISVFDYGEDGDSLFIAFEFIAGETLEDVLSRDGRFDPMRVSDVLQMALASLTEAHGMGVLHRDIKPGNIMLSHRNGVPDWVTVLDFGIAKIMRDATDEGELTTTGAALGTPRYMAPEQISGERLGPESDIYSLGLVAYELLTGERAIAGENTLQIITNQLDPQSPILPSNLGVPAALAMVVNKMMRKERHLRYLHARDVLRDLHQLNRTVGDATVDIGER